MDDIEKGADSKDSWVAEKSPDSLDSSPVSRRSSKDIESGPNGYRGAHIDAQLDQESQDDKTAVPQQNPQSVIVNWDGPDDPEFPQNLYVLPMDS